MIGSSQEKILDIVISVMVKLKKNITNTSIRQFISGQIMHNTELCAKVKKLRSAQISEYCAKHNIKYD